jgi:hypothetical protein
MITIWQAFLGAVGAGAFLGILTLIKAIIKLSKNIDKLIATDMAQTQAIYIIAKIQRPQLAAHKATLEALKGECNGNVDAAHSSIIKATEEYDTFLASRL